MLGVQFLLTTDTDFQNFSNVHSKDDTIFHNLSFLDIPR